MLLSSSQTDHRTEVPTHCTCQETFLYLLSTVAACSTCLPGIGQLQFGVNLIVFALTQKGSIGSRVMDSVR